MKELRQAVDLAVRSRGRTLTLHAWRRKTWKEKLLTIFLERTREGHRQSDEHFNRFNKTGKKRMERKKKAALTLKTHKIDITTTVLSIAKSISESSSFRVLQDLEKS